MKSGAVFRKHSSDAFAEDDDSAPAGGSRTATSSPPIAAQALQYASTQYDDPIAPTCARAAYSSSTSPLPSALTLPAETRLRGRRAEALLYTGQRRGDVARPGKQHLRDGILSFTQVKNAKRKPVRLDIPVVPELQRIIDATPSTALTFLTSERSGAYTVDSFGNRFRA